MLIFLVFVLQNAEVFGKLPKEIFILILRSLGFSQIDWLMGLFPKLKKFPKLFKYVSSYTFEKHMTNSNYKYIAKNPNYTVDLFRKSVDPFLDAWWFSGNANVTLELAKEFSDAHWNYFKLLKVLSIEECLKLSDFLLKVLPRDIVTLELVKKIPYV